MNSSSMFIVWASIPWISTTRLSVSNIPLVNMARRYGEQPAKTTCSEIKFCETAKTLLCVSEKEKKTHPQRDICVKKDNPDRLENARHTLWAWKFWLLTLSVTSHSSFRSLISCITWSEIRQTGDIYPLVGSSRRFVRISLTNENSFSVLWKRLVNANLSHLARPKDNPSQKCRDYAWLCYFRAGCLKYLVVFYGTPKTGDGKTSSEKTVAQVLSHTEIASVFKQDCLSCVAYPRLRYLTWNARVVWVCTGMNLSGIMATAEIKPKTIGTSWMNTLFADARTLLASCCWHRGSFILWKLWWCTCFNTAQVRTKLVHLWPSSNKWTEQKHCAKRALISVEAALHHVITSREALHLSDRWALPLRWVWLTGGQQFC